MSTTKNQFTSQIANHALGSVSRKLVPQLPETCLIRHKVNSATFVDGNPQNERPLINVPVDLNYNLQSWLEQNPREEPFTSYRLRPDANLQQLRSRSEI